MKTHLTPTNLGGEAPNPRWGTVMKSIDTDAFVQMRDQEKTNE